MEAHLQAQETLRRNSNVVRMGFAALLRELTAEMSGGYEAPGGRLICKLQMDPVIIDSQPYEAWLNGISIKGFSNHSLMGSELTLLTRDQDETVTNIHYADLRITAGMESLPTLSPLRADSRHIRL